MRLVRQYLIIKKRYWAFKEAMPSERIICPSTILTSLLLVPFFYAATCMDKNSAERDLAEQLIFKKISFIQ